MIKRNTVLILGAGASHPHGYPLGSGLKADIVQSIGEAQRPEAGGGLGRTPLNEFLWRRGFENREILQFRMDLKDSPIGSVDVFLERRKGEFLELGKHAIAWQIIQSRGNEILSGTEKGRWYDYLWTLLDNDFEQIGQNNVTFVTYNYDLSLERWFLQSLQATYGKTRKEAEDKLAEIRIIHVHGHVKSGNREPGEGEDDSVISESAEQIKIIHELDDGDKEYVAARKALVEAKHIHLLGFGYNKQNLKRLFADHPQYWSGSVFGTTKRMGDSERRIARSRILKYSQSSQPIQMILNIDESAEYGVYEHLRNVFRHE